MLKLTRAPLCERVEGESCTLFSTPTQGLKYITQLWKYSGNGLAQRRPLLGLKGHSRGWGVSNALNSQTAYPGSKAHTSAFGQNRKILFLFGSLEK